MSISKTFVCSPTWWCLLISEHWRGFGKCFLDNIAAADQLQQCSSGPRTLHDLSCQFGTKGNFLKDKTDFIKKSNEKYQCVKVSVVVCRVQQRDATNRRRFAVRSQKVSTAGIYVHLFKKNKKNIKSLVSYILWGGRDRETRNVVWRKVGERIFQGFQLISSGLELNPGIDESQKSKF